MAQEKEYWMSELSNRAKSTKEKYRMMFDLFSGFVGMSAEEIIEKRKEDLRKEEPREQRRFESQLKAFVGYLKEEKNYSIASQQVAWSAVKSFFETNYYPLQTRKGDYPQGESLGYRPFSKMELRMLLQETKMSLRTKTIVMLLKDSGLRVGDLVRLTYGDVADQLERGEKYITVKLVTKKSKIVAKTFFGEESVSLLMKYLEKRRKGTRRVPPETVTRESWLIRNASQFKKTSRSGVSSLVGQYIAKAGLNGELSAHSLRKYTQTQLESAGVHPNWVQQILGHKLTNSEGSYSRPTDEMLRSAYIKAYDSLRIFPRVVTTDDISDLVEENRQLKEEISRLKERQDEINGSREAMYQEFMKRLKKELNLG